MQPLLLAIPVLLACLVPSGCRHPEGRAARPGDPAKAVGEPLEPFDLPSAGGGTVTWGPGSHGGSAAATFVHAFQPDCPSCRQQARALEKVRREHEAARVIGVAHRGTAQQIEAFREATGVSYPLAVGAGSPWARRWGLGDPMYVVDPDGLVRYAQVGFHPGDAPRWSTVVRDLAAGRAPKATGPGRATVAQGRRMPAIDLPDLSGRPLRLAAEDGRLVFTPDDGPPQHPRAAAGFFSRY